MRRVFRIVHGQFAESAFTGEGSFLFAGRWSSPGTRIVYASEHLSLAVLEYLAHLNPLRPPLDTVLAFADIPDGVTRTRLPVSDLPAGWQESPAPESLAVLGDRFIAENKYWILIVPSAIVPLECNYLLNPRSPEFSRIVQYAPERFRFDSRLKAR